MCRVEYRDSLRSPLGSTATGRNETEKRYGYLSVEGKRWPLSSSASPEGTAPEPEAETVATVAALLVEPDKRSRVATACGARRGRGRNEGKRVVVVVGWWLCVCVGGVATVRRVEGTGACAGRV